jgi:hypothetical protein
VNDGGDVVIDPNMSVEELVRLGAEHVCLTLGLTVYFREPLHTFRDATGQLLEAYLEHAEPHLHWYADSVTARFKPPTPEMLRLPEQILAEPGRDKKGCSWIYLGGKRHQDLSPWYLYAVSNVEYRNTLSYVTLSFPVDHWASDFPGFASWVERVTAPLPVFHGYAGFAFGQGEDGGPPQHTRRYIFPLAMRFHGVEVDLPHLSDRSCYRHIKGVNWLTLVGESLLDPLGGIEMATAALGREEGITVHRMPWGLCIQAGDKPSIGDTDQGNVLPLYRKVNRVLRPIRTRTHFPLGDAFGTAGTLAWLRRFDDFDAAEDL